MLALLALFCLCCLLDSPALLSEGIQSNAFSVVFFRLKTACIQGHALSESIQGHVRMQSHIIFTQGQRALRGGTTFHRVSLSRVCLTFSSDVWFPFEIAFLLCVLSHWSYLFRGGLFVDAHFLLLAWRAQPFWLVPARLCFYGVHV